MTTNTDGVSAMSAELSNLHRRNTMDTKPQAEKPVLAWDGEQWVRAMWVPQHSKEHHGDGDWYVYNEADDTYYWPEGWYELQTHGGDQMLWHLTDGATAWQDLPPAPLFNKEMEADARLIAAAPGGRHLPNSVRDCEVVGEHRQHGVIYGTIIKVEAERAERKAVSAERERNERLRAELRRVQDFIDQTPDLFDALGPLQFEEASEQRR